MQRTTIKLLNTLANSLTKLTGVEYSIEQGSKLYGNGWKLTSANGSHTFLHGVTAAELEGKLRAYYSGYYDAKHAGEA